MCGWRWFHTSKLCRYVPIAPDASSSTAAAWVGTVTSITSTRRSRSSHLPFGRTDARLALTAATGPSRCTSWVTKYGPTSRSGPPPGREQEGRVRMPQLGAAVRADHREADHLTELARVDHGARRLPARAEERVGRRAEQPARRPAPGRGAARLRPSSRRAASRCTRACRPRAPPWSRSACTTGGVRLITIGDLRIREQLVRGAPALDAVAAPPHPRRARRRHRRFARCEPARETAPGRWRTCRRSCRSR